MLDQRRAARRFVAVKGHHTPIDLDVRIAFDNHAIMAP